MGKEIIRFGDIEVERHKCHQSKSPISIHYVNIDKIIVSNKIPLAKKGFEYFVWLKNDYEKVMALYIMLPKMGEYRIDFDKTKYMAFSIKDMNCKKNRMKSGIKSAIILKRI